LSGSLEAINLGDRLFEKMAQFTEGDAKKLAILMENILLEVDEGIYKAIPWIKNLENRPSNKSFEGMDEKELKERFIDHISGWVRLVVKFELHQSDSMASCIEGRTTGDHQALACASDAYTLELPQKLAHPLTHLRKLGPYYNCSAQRGGMKTCCKLHHT